MPNCEEKGKSRVKPTFITSFVPRQLLLSSSSSKSTMGQLDKANSGKPINSLSSQDRIRLFHTICEFLELNGFHKTLKKFRCEADIEKDSWKNCSLNLEELFQEHLWMRNDAGEKLLKQKGISDKTEEKNKEHQGDDGKKSEATLENGTVTDDDIKPKKKKKSKSGDASDQVNTDNHLKTSEHQGGDTLSEPAEAVKKSKKKQKDASEPSDKDLKEQSAGDALSIPSEPVKKSKDKKKKNKDEAKVDEAGKGSKKRKKSSSEDLADGDAEERATDDTKRRKVDDSDKSNGDVQAPKTPTQTSNGNMEEDGGEKAREQEKTKERNGSAEPTSVKAFQRVKAEEVKFIDDRLKDNSYWAKDGAESGFGAKAQEVLGQVRGRDFRHEKTKKKRGSYRGGQIDLQSHSIKFNYDDDDDEE